MRSETQVIDKSTWGDGPWQNEPDRVDWVHAGFACLALRHPSHGHWCGYVGVPREHPAYGKPYDEVDAPFHWDLNYAAPCEGAICHVPEPGMPDDVWWLGGDFGHMLDLSPGREARLREVQKTAAELQIAEAFREVYRDLSCVQSVVNECAEALAAMETGNPREQDAAGAAAEGRATEGRAAC
jgi:hypothetical protein